jgi:hypothetical protein
VPVPCFLLFLCFKKVTQEIFSKLDETKASRPEFHRSFQWTEEEMDWGHEGPTHQGGAARGWAVPPMCETASIHSWRCPFAYKDSQREKPKYPITFPEHIAIRRCHQPKDREGLEALLGTLPERGIATGSLLYRHTCLRRDEWVVYLGLWVHSSS